MTTYGMPSGKSVLSQKPKCYCPPQQLHFLSNMFAEQRNLWQSIKQHLRGIQYLRYCTPSECPNMSFHEIPTKTYTGNP